MERDCLMEHFQELDLLNIQSNIFNAIKNYCLDKYPYESGGLVKNYSEIIFCESIRKDLINFVPDKIFYNHLCKPDDISFTFHSHLFSADPSENDIFFIKNFDIPIIIYSLKYNIFSGVNIKNEKIITTWYFEEAGMWKLNSQS